MTRIEPSGTIEARITLPPVERSAHQRDWPTVTVTERTTVVAIEPWGSRAATYEITADALVDIRNGHTHAAFAEAKITAGYRIRRTANDIATSNPDYATPARY